MRLTPLIVLLSMAYLASRGQQHRKRVVEGSESIVWFRESTLILHDVFPLTMTDRGIIDTPMFQNSPKPFVERLEMAVEGSPLGRKGEPEEIADFIVYLLGNESSYITGQVLPIDGGLLA
jgi:hypothetical protein